MSLKVSTWAIRNPVPVSLLFVLLMIAGAAAYALLPVKQFPDVSFPEITVAVTQSGAAPSEMESQVTRLVEDAAASVPGVKHLTSTVSLGSSETKVEFAVGADAQRALEDVRSAIDRIRVDLPQGIDPPSVTRRDTDGQPILYYAVTAPKLSATQLSWFVDNTVARALQGVAGVGLVTRTGGLDREINVLLDIQRMNALGVTAPQVNSALRQFTDDASGGRAELGDREMTVRVLGGAVSIDQLRDLQIPLRGRAVRLGDIAEVGDGAGEARGFARVNNVPVAAFQISKTKTASEVETETNVVKALDALAKANPGVRFTKVMSTVTETRASYQATIHVLIEGMILAALVVMLFLRDWRATLISAVAMPLSLIPTFAVMHLLGFSLNIVTLLALTLVIGILVDDAIVEVENIEKRIARGQHPYRAALEGADAIGLAVVATTFTIVVIFTPVSMMQSTIGQFFREFGLTVAVAVLFSLVVARLVTPVMAAYFLVPARRPHEARPMPRFYRRALDWSLRRRGWAIGLGGLFFVATLIIGIGLPKGFQPEGDSGYIFLNIQGEPGATRADMERAAAKATDILRAQADTDFVFSQVGADGDSTTGLIIGVLKADRVQTTKAVRNAVRPLLRQVADARVVTGDEDGGDADVEVILASADGKALARAQTELLRQMRTVRQVTEPRPAPAAASVQLVIRPKPAEAARLNVSTDAIAQIARVATLGDIDANVPKFSEGERRLPIRVRLPLADRADLARISQLAVPTMDGKTTVLESVADISFEAGPGHILRYDRERRASVQADFNNAAIIGQASEAIAALPIMQHLPAGVHEAKDGDEEDMVQLFSGLIVAMGAGVALVYAVMVLLFRSFFKPISILSALPLSLGGAFIALRLAGLPLDLPVMIGLLMLLGLAAKNSILLVEFAIEAEREGLDRFSALERACAERSRPIIMTTVAMIAGMAPTALGLGEGAEWRQPMAVAVIGGLVSSTLLSLILVPVVYEFVDDVEGWLTPRLARFVTPSPPAADTLAREDAL
ncbi:AcrB/AcrD/AcrF family protein [Caulobacter segnis]|uniref:Acriflavin resistance protein n=2 Tax=Caulobacter segnis TaxID=88688 RepID=D5VLS3_CAUST|nr:efflux RND transporter permease subunit [Caulobacter segnis]ADG11446.1 acriflavin resistance protein [Caulobacter segnis ATCC 21756]AVQ03109.1 AcrB/AcrD/AcrF family protein [Caulobacter segnis]